MYNKWRFMKHNNFHLALIHLELMECFASLLSLMVTGLKWIMETQMYPGYNNKQKELII